MCCGSKRSALISSSTSIRAPRTTPLVAASAYNRPPGSTPRLNPPAMTPPLSTLGLSHSVTLVYTGTSPISVRGPVTGRRYDFSGARSGQPVDPRDAAVFMRSSLFRRT